MNAGQHGIVLVTACAVWFAGTGCAQIKPLARYCPADGEELPILSESTDSFSNIARPLRAAIYDGATLSQFVIRPLVVDFERHMVLLAAMGPAVSRECGVRIRRVWRDGGRLRVEVEQFYAAASAPRRPGSGSPYCAVVVPRCELPFERFRAALPANTFTHGTKRQP